MATKKDESVIRTDSLTIEGNMLDWEGDMVAISNISRVRVEKENPVPMPKGAIVLIVAGILGGLFMMGGSIIYLFIGLAVAAVGVFLLASWNSENTKRTNRRVLMLLLNAGESFRIGYFEPAFAQKVAKVLSTLISAPDKTANVTVNMNNNTLTGSASGVTFSGH